MSVVAQSPFRFFQRVDRYSRGGILGFSRRLPLSGSFWIAVFLLLLILHHFQQGILKHPTIQSYGNTADEGLLLA